MSNLHNLFDAVSLLLTQYRLHVALLDRQRTIRQVRSLIAAAIHDFLESAPKDLRALRETISAGLAKQEKSASRQDAMHEEYIKYCLREIALAFELADQIYSEFRHKPEVAKTLISDLPILRPFDYGIRQETTAEESPLAEEKIA
jgi:hypothetical protein